MTMTREREKYIIEVSKSFLFQLLLPNLRNNQLLPSERFLYMLKYTVQSSHTNIKTTNITFFKEKRKQTFYFFFLRRQKENNNNLDFVILSCIFFTYFV